MVRIDNKDSLVQFLIIIHASFIFLIFVTISKISYSYSLIDYLTCSKIIKHLSFNILIKLDSLG